VAAEGYRRALDVLRASASPAGFRAAAGAGRNYDRVWTRDGVVCGLAAVLTGDDELVDAFERTLATIRDRLGPSGEVPSNVSAAGEVSYGTAVGRVDAPAWYVLGIAALGRARPEAAATHGDATARALALLSAWELNAGGLVWVPPGGCWLDELPLHGYVLNVQLLRLWALRAVGSADAARVQAAVEARLVGPAGPLASAGPHGDETRSDGLGLGLALLLGVDAERARERLEAVAAQTGSPLVPAFWPVVEPGDELWPALERYHLHGFRNEPGRFHNGGLWPFATGFAAAGHARAGDAARAERLADAIDQANARGGWRFSEYHDARTGLPGGTAGQAWSAAAAVIARHAAAGELPPGL
jgi:GH15 family glucan-1,4-alpha-glucosidase